MNATSPRTIAWNLFKIAAISLLIYGVSFVWFIRSHITDGLRGPFGHALTTTYLEVPDTPFNRVLNALYQPATRYFVGPIPTDWEKP